MFAHLHLHTEYSLLDGACRIEQLADTLKEKGFTSCAITDHGAMYGVVDFSLALEKRGIRPIIGCEMYTARDMDDKTDREMNHLILLCENNIGYQNLIKLNSAGFVRGYYYRPRIDEKLLSEHHEGLIALSACLSGRLPKLCLDGNMKAAEEYALHMQDIFGKGNYFIELMNHNIPDEKRVLPLLLQVARNTGIPTVVTNDVHYIAREDAAAQEVLMCIQTGKTMSDTARMRMETSELYLKDEREMLELFPYAKDAVERTQEIADRCRVEFDFKHIHLPSFPIDTGENSLEMLTRLCREGLSARYGSGNEEAEKRLEYELSVIAQMGYVDYFLIVWDFIRYAKENGIMVGPGRGSGAGSIVAYTLNITKLDPLKYNLLFERFLNPERVSMPDIDVDFCYERRQEVIDYVAVKYGADHVSQIGTFGTMAARGVIRDVGRVLDFSYQETDSVAKAIPMDLGMTLNKALEISPQLKAMYTGDEHIAQLIDTALKLEGMPRHTSTHAAGVLITHKPVTEYVPLMRNDEIIATQYPMGMIEKLGLLKMDFLGLRTLTVIRDTLAMLEKRDIHIKVDDIPVDDKNIYDMISAGETDGVFQLESGGMRQFLTNMKPQNFEDIIAAISLYRPGPMQSIPRYVAGKLDPSSVTYKHELLRPILEVTYGCMVYQEQVMQIVRDLAGYSYGRSDLMRRAMAKKKKDVMAQEREYFIHGLTDENGKLVVDGAVRRGVPESVAEDIFNEMSDFASYAFNKSHAAAYALVAVQTAYLKFYYPVEFMASMMNSFIGASGKVAVYIQYIRSVGISLLPPDVNRSFTKFSSDKDENGKLAIRFALGAVKNVGEQAVDSLVLEREKNGEFKDVFDFCRRVDPGTVNKRAVEGLIMAGAFDRLKGERSQLLAVYESLLDERSASLKRNIDGQVSIFDMGASSAPLADVFKQSLPNMPPHTRRAMLSMEKEMTGVYITGHPLDEYREQLEKFRWNVKALMELADDEIMKANADGESVAMGGIIASVRSKATKKGALMGFCVLEDLYGQVECLLFPRVFEKYSDLLSADKIVVMTGKLSAREEEDIKLLVDTVAEMGKAPVIPAAAAKPLPVKPLPAQDKVQKLFIRIPSARQDEVKTLITLHPGLTPVVLHFPDTKQTLQAPQSMWIDADAQFILKLKQKLGDENVVLK